MVEAGKTILTDSLTIAPDLAEVASARRFVAGVASEAGFAGERVFDITVACSEAVANAVEHSPTKGEVRVRVILHPDRLEIEVKGPGEFQAPDRLKERGSRGLGLPLMARLADHLALFSGPDGQTFVSLTFYRPGAQRKETGPVAPSFVNLAEEDRLLDDVLRKFPDGFYVLDDDWRFVYLNPSVLASLAKRRQQVIGQVLWDALPGWTDEERRLLERAKADGITVTFDREAESPFGWREWTVFPVEEGMAVISRDITGRRQAEEAAHESDERFRVMFEDHAVPMMLIEPESGRISDANEAAARYYGYARDRLRTMNIADINQLPPEEVAAERRKAVESRQNMFVFRHRMADGTPRWVEVYASPVRVGGRPTLFSIIHDITERKEAEEALRRSEAQYRALFDSIDEGYCIIEVIFDDSGRSMDYVFLEVNEAFERQTGIKDAVGRRMRDIAPQHEQRWFDVFGEVVRTGEPIRFENAAEAIGHYYDVYAFKINEPEQHQAAVLFTDISERKRREGNDRLLREIFVGLAGLENPDEIIEAVGARLGEYFGIGTLNFCTVDDPNDRLTVVHGWRTGEAPDLLRTFRMSDYFSESLKQASRRGESVAVGDALSDSRTEAAGYTRIGIRSFLSVPFLTGGRWTNSLTVTDGIPRTWRADELALFEELSAIVFPWIERARTQQTLAASEERHRSLAEENERLYRQQLDIAESLQLALLNIPSTMGPVRLGHLYRSATQAAQVGGDFYDAFEVKGARVAMLVGDVAGHGIEAARTATLVKDVVHAFIHQSLRPHQVLRRTNALLLEKNLPGFVTLFLAILETETGLLRYASAGHPETLLRRSSGEIQTLESGSPPLGVYAGTTWKTTDILMEAGDLLLLYTDGVLETRRNKEFFGRNRLERLLKRKRNTVERLPHLILDQLLAFSGGTLTDDVAVLAVSLADKPRMSGAQPGDHQGR